MIVLLIIVTLGFLFLNYILSDHDYMHPAVIFHLVFFVYEFVCLCGTSAYAVSLHEGSVLVLTTGFIAITATNIFSHRYRGYKVPYTIELREIRIPKVYLRILILMQIISIVSFYQYLSELAVAYGGSYGIAPDSLSGMIKLYDTMTKFWESIFNELAVPIPLGYRISNPICASAEYIVLYGMINNFLIKKRKVNKWEIMVLIFMCVRIVMNGSRSPLLRIFTFIFFLIYVFNYRIGKIRKGNMKFLRKLIIATGSFGFAMFIVLFIMGRMTNFTSIGDHLFVYLGAPIVNLDTFIENNTIQTIGSVNENELFGAHVFKGLYSYIVKLFEINSFTKIDSIDTFAFSSNGHEIGNVYTMFYKIVYDFGYLGVFPITVIMGIYYAETYKKIMVKQPNKKVIDFRLLIYAYLFNDVVMSAFSTRFYETVFDAPFIKFIVMAWLLDYFFVEKRISFTMMKLTVTRKET